MFVQDHPEQEPLYLVRGLFNATKERDFRDPDRKAKLFLNFVSYANAAGKQNYAYAIDNG